MDRDHGHFSGGQQFVDYAAEQRIGHGDVHRDLGVTGDSYTTGPSLVTSANDGDVLGTAGVSLAESRALHCKEASEDGIRHQPGNKHPPEVSLGFLWAGQKGNAGEQCDEWASPMGASGGGQTGAEFGPYSPGSGSQGGPGAGNSSHGAMAALQLVVDRMAHGSGIEGMQG